MKRAASDTDLSGGGGGGAKQPRARWASAAGLVSRRLASTPQRYQVLAHSAQETLAQRLVELDAARFTYHATSWASFPDGTDNIQVGGFANNRNLLRGEHVVFLASFHSNGATLSQLHVVIMLLQSFIESLTIILPFYPCATMERVVVEGQVATANTMAQMFSHLPSCGRLPSAVTTSFLLFLVSSAVA